MPHTTIAAGDAQAGDLIREVKHFAANPLTSYYGIVRTTPTLLIDQFGQKWSIKTLRRVPSKKFQKGDPITEVSVVRKTK